MLASILNTFTSGRVVGAPRRPESCVSQFEPKPSADGAEGAGCVQNS
jgi:hypothetical protein